MLNSEAQDFIGTHDFSAFCAAGSSVEGKIRTVKNASVIRNNEIIEFTFEADGFLYNMVRIMVGTLLDINRGKIVPGSIPQIIESKDRNQAGEKSVCKKKEQGTGAYSQTDKICFDCVGNTDFAVYYG